MKALGPEAIIWDMDGTLVDTAQHHFSAWRNAARSAGREFSTEDFAKTFGRRNPEVITYLFGDSMSVSAGEQLANRKEEEYRAEVMRQGVDLLPGARKILEAFQAAGYRQAIGTSAPRANLEQILQQTRIGTLFQVTITGQDTVNGKPNPEVFLKAARLLGVTPERCVVFEDAEAGVLAAKSAGMKCVGVCTGGHSSAADLLAAGADLVIKNLEFIDLAAVEAL
jgi:beta-phosphoglucomutase